jgi:hypothetical protein
LDERRRRVEALGELFRRAVAEHRELARQRQAELVGALQLAQRHHLPLQRAEGAGEGMRAMRADSATSRPARGCRAAKAWPTIAAVGRTDEGVQAAMPSRSSAWRDGVGLVLAADRRVDVTVGTDPVAGDQAVALRIERGMAIDQFLPPAGLRVAWFAQAWRWALMPPASQTAGSWDRRTTPPQGTRRVPAWRIGSSNSKRCWPPEGRLAFSSTPKQSGSLCAGAQASAEARDMARSGVDDAPSRPEAGSEAVHVGGRIYPARHAHLPAARIDSIAHLPQDLAPAGRVLAPAGCPGFKGPVPLPVLMAGRQSAGRIPGCQSFHRDTAMDSPARTLARDSCHLPATRGRESLRLVKHPLKATPCARPVFPLLCWPAPSRWALPRMPPWSHAQVTEAVQLEASASAGLSGRVREAARNYFLEGARVQVDGRVVSTDREGRFRLDGIAPGRYTLEVDFVGYAPRSEVELAEGQRPGCRCRPDQHRGTAELDARSKCAPPATPRRWR